MKGCVISCAPWKVQSPSEPQLHPKYTPNPLPKPKHEKKHVKVEVFVHFSEFFCTSVSVVDLACILGCILFLSFVDEGQITHLICARLKYELYDFLRGCFSAFSTRKRRGSRPKTPLKKSYRSYFRRAQIR